MHQGFDIDNFYPTGNEGGRMVSYRKDSNLFSNIMSFTILACTSGLLNLAFISRDVLASEGDMKAHIGQPMIGYKHNHKLVEYVFSNHGKLRMVEGVCENTANKRPIYDGGVAVTIGNGYTEDACLEQNMLVEDMEYQHCRDLANWALADFTRLPILDPATLISWERKLVSSSERLYRKCTKIVRKKAMIESLEGDIAQLKEQLAINAMQVETSSSLTENQIKKINKQISNKEEKIENLNNRITHIETTAIPRTEESIKIARAKLGGDFAADFMASCITPEGLELLHDESEERDSFLAAEVEYGELCGDMIKQFRTCNNGIVSDWSHDFQYLTCTVKKDPRISAGEDIAEKLSIEGSALSKLLQKIKDLKN